MVHGIEQEETTIPGKKRRIPTDGRAGQQNDDRGREETGPRDILLRGTRFCEQHKQNFGGGPEEKICEHRRDVACCKYLDIS